MTIRRYLFATTCILALGCAQRAESPRPRKPKPAVVVQYGDFGEEMALWVESGDCTHTDKLLTVGRRVLEKRGVDPATFEEEFADLKKKGRKVTDDVAEELARRLRGLK